MLGVLIVPLISCQIIRVHYEPSEVFYLSEEGKNAVDVLCHVFFSFFVNLNRKHIVSI